MNKTKPALFFVSDEAYGRLTRLGQRQSYINITPQRVNGMSKFLEDLSSANFKDTRPLNVKQRHESEVRLGHAPTWISYHVRRQRLLTISDTSMIRYMGIALSFGIITPEPYAVGGPSRLTMIPTTSLVLEGIGLGWITPVTVPLKGNSRV
jgi:hypothetical protein